MSANFKILSDFSGTLLTKISRERQIELLRSIAKEFRLNTNIKTFLICQTVRRNQI